MDMRLPVLNYDTEGVDVEPTCFTERHTDSNAAATPIAADQQKVQPSHTRRKLAAQPSCSSKADAGKPDEPDQASSAAMQELSNERRRRAFIGMLKLLEDGARDARQLEQLAAPMSGEELLQVAEERSLAGKCGNPLCTQPFAWQEPRRKYRVVADNIHKVEGDCYCSKPCGSFMHALAAQLANPLARIKPDALQQYLSGPSHNQRQQQQQGVAAQGGGVPTMRAVIEERDPYQIIHESEEAGRQLEGAAACQAGNSAAAAAVEGFVPRVTPDRQPRATLQPSTCGATAAAGVDGAAADDADDSSGQLEVLQLQLKMAKPAPPVELSQPSSSSSSSAAAAEAAATAPGAASASELALLREHQEQQLRQVLQAQQGRAMYVPQDTVQALAAAGRPQAPATDSSINSSSNQTPAATHTADAGRGEAAGATGTAAAAAAGAATAASPQRRRTVTFAPDVSYSCPAEQHEPPEQPVLTFNMVPPCSSQGPDSSSSSSAGLVGELKLASAADLDPDSSASEDDDTESRAQQQSAAAMPGDPWRLWLPPALGGVGVPVKVKQSVKTPAKPCKQKQAHEAAPASLQQQQQPQQQLHQEGDSGAAATALSRHTVRHKVEEAFRAPVSQASKPKDGQAGMQSIHSSSSSSSRSSANDSTGDVAFTASTAAPAAAPAAPAAARPRRFAPTVRPRRSVQLLEEVPGVQVQQRGAKTRSSSSSAGSSSSSSSNPPSSTARNVPPQPLPPQQQQQQQQHIVSECGSTAAGAPAAGCGSVQPGVSLRPSSPVCSSNQRVGQHRLGTVNAAACSSTKRSSSDSEPLNVLAVRDRGGSSSCRVQPHCLRSSNNNNHGGGASSSAESDSDSDSRSEDTEQQWSDGDDDAAAAAAMTNGSSKGTPWPNRASASNSEDGSSEDGDGGDSSSGDDDGGVGGSMSEALGAVLPFLDTSGVSVHLSEFGLLWNHLHSWISPATVDYANSKPHEVADSSSKTSSSRSNGTLQQSKQSGAAAATAAAVAVPPSVTVVQQRAAMASLLGHALPAVVQQLGIKVPLSELSKQLHALVRTFNMPGPLPALELQQWQLVVALMLAALSAWQLPVLRPVFFSQGRQPAGGRLDELVLSLGSDLDRFAALLDLFELQV